MVQDAADVPEGPVNLDSVRVVFNEERLVSDAGLLTTATLAERLGIEEVVNESVWLDPRAPGACLPGRKRDRPAGVPPRPAGGNDLRARARLALRPDRREAAVPARDRHAIRGRAGG